MPLLLSNRPRRSATIAESFGLATDEMVREIRPGHKEERTFYEVAIVDEVLQKIDLRLLGRPPAGDGTSTAQASGRRRAEMDPAASTSAAGGNGAPRGTRTHDPLIKNQLLYQLS